MTSVYYPTKSLRELLHREAWVAPSYSKSSRELLGIDAKTPKPQRHLRE
jgi:hypothetical protein